MHACVLRLTVCFPVHPVSHHRQSCGSSNTRINMFTDEDNMVDVDFKQPDQVSIKSGVGKGEERTFREGLILPDTTIFNLLIIVYMVILTLTSFVLMILAPLVVYWYIQFEMMKYNEDQGLLRFILLTMAGIVLILSVNNAIGWIAIRTMQMKYLYLNVALKCISLLTTVLFFSLMTFHAVWLCLIIQIPIVCIALGIVYLMREANREPRYRIESLINTP